MAALDNSYNRRLLSAIFEPPPNNRLQRTALRAAVEPER